MKIAYLILAHTDPYQLKRLIQALSVEGQVSFYVHIDARKDLSVFKEEVSSLSNVYFLRERKKIYWAGFSICEAEKLLFSGDTLFRGTWGRTDLPTSDFQSIIDSVTNKLMILPDETIVYPGHGKSTKIGEEKPIYLELKPRGY